MQRQLLLLVGVVADLPLAACWVGSARPPLLFERGGVWAAVHGASAGSSGTNLKAAGDYASSTSQQNKASTLMAGWARGLVAVCAALVVLVAGTPRAASAAGGVNVYFGQGCFWHVQHEFIKKEAADLKRKGPELTALAGYAGGEKVGDKGQVCYHNPYKAPDYGRMGHSEVVGLTIPEADVKSFTEMYVDAAMSYPFGRADPQDMGGEYRSVIGIPGGVEGPLFDQVKAANKGRMTLLAGKGNDGDTVGTKNVWVYDSNKFPFHQGEVYHQFHDDMIERYSKEYHDIKGIMKQSGNLKPVDCPEMNF